MMLRNIGLVASVFAVAVSAQSATVTNNADAGAGSLRDALTSANNSAAAGFVIQIAPAATAAPIVLTSYLPSLTHAAVTIQAQSGAGRLIVDASGLTSASGYGMDIAGNGAQVLAPLRVRVSAGNGVVARGVGMTLADIDIVSVGAVPAATGLVATAGANDLVVDRITVTGFQQGIRLQDCSNARFATVGSGTAEASNCTGIGIAINNGSGHWVGSFLCTGDDLGISATNSPALRLGRANAGRSSASSCRQQGILLTQCAAASVLHIDLLGNGTGPSGGAGLQIVGGDGATVSDLVADGNTYGGITIDGGATRLRLGPAVATHGFGGAQDVGLAVRQASVVTVYGCSFGPNHRFGVVLSAGGGGYPANIVLAQCVITGNLLTGASVLRSQDVLFAECTIDGNFGRGVEVIGSSPATAPYRITMAGCSISNNAATGLIGQTYDSLQIGPGNRIDDNYYSGVQAFGGVTLGIRDNLSIDGNRAEGIWIQDTTGTAVKTSSLRDNRGSGIYALRCSGLVIGPEIEIRDTIGSGVYLEGCNGCELVSSRLVANSAYGLETSDALGAPATAANRARSCLIAGQVGIGVFHLGGAPLICELCTIAGNLRGVFCGANALTVASSIVVDNQIEDLQSTATGLSVDHSFHQVPAPAVGSTNSAADPLFVAPASQDWRLQATSPAVGAANPALTLPSGSRDAYDGARPVNALDAGAYEVGPHPNGTETKLLLSSSTMLHGGGGLAFDIRYPPTAVGMLSLVLAELGPPSGSFSVFGATIPLGLNPALLLVAQDPNSLGGIAFIGVGGVVQGALLWSGLLPPTVQNLPISLCAIAMDLTPTIHAVSNTATFTVQ